MRYLLLAVWILVSAGAANADWNEVMETLERATRGPAYDVGANPSEPNWVATRKARFEDEPVRPHGADPDPAARRHPASCRTSSLSGPLLHCD